MGGGLLRKLERVRAQLPGLFQRFQRLLLRERGTGRSEQYRSKGAGQESEERRHGHVQTEDRTRLQAAQSGPSPSRSSTATKLAGPHPKLSPTPPA